MRVKRKTDVKDKERLIQQVFLEMLCKLHSELKIEDKRKRELSLYYNIPFNTVKCVCANIGREFGIFGASVEDRLKVSNYGKCIEYILSKHGIIIENEEYILVNSGISIRNSTILKELKEMGIIMTPKELLQVLGEYHIATCFSQCSYDFVVARKFADKCKMFHTEEERNSQIIAELCEFYSKHVNIKKTVDLAAAFLENNFAFRDVYGLALLISQRVTIPANLKEYDELSNEESTKILPRQPKSKVLGKLPQASLPSSFDKQDLQENSVDYQEYIDDYFKDGIELLDWFGIEQCRATTSVINVGINESCSYKKDNEGDTQDSRPSSEILTPTSWKEKTRECALRESLSLLYPKGGLKSQKRSNSQITPDRDILTGGRVL